MLNFIQSHIGIVIGCGTIGAAIGGFILKKTGVLKKLEVLFKKAELWAQGLISVFDRAGINTGVVITTKANKVPFLGIIYEYTFEPIIIVVCNGVASVISPILRAVIAFILAIPVGLRTDNKDIKKKKKSK